MRDEEHTSRQIYVFCEGDFEECYTIEGYTLEEARAYCRGIGSGSSYCYCSGSTVAYVIPGDEVAMKEEQGFYP